MLKDAVAELPRFESELEDLHKRKATKEDVYMVESMCENTFVKLMNFDNFVLKLNDTQF